MLKPKNRLHPVNVILLSMLSLLSLLSLISIPVQAHTAVATNATAAGTTNWTNKYFAVLANELVPEIIAITGRPFLARITVANYLRVSSGKQLQKSWPLPLPTSPTMILCAGWSMRLSNFGDPL